MDTVDKWISSKGPMSSSVFFLIARYRAFKAAKFPTAVLWVEAIENFLQGWSLGGI